MQGYDFNGIITKGFTPKKGDVVISGHRNLEEIKKLVPEGIKIYHFMGKIKGDDTSNVVKLANKIKGSKIASSAKDFIVGHYKAKMVKKLGVTTFYEDTPEQAKIIKDMNPDVEVINPIKGKTVLIITDEWLAPSLALSLKNEGHNVLLAVKRPTNVLKGSIKRVNYADRLIYAKDADLVIYEDKSNKGEASELRESGVSVIGGDKLSDRIELDRVWGNKIASISGMLAPKMFELTSFEELRNHIKENPARWVLKQQGKLDEVKGLNFMSKMPHSEDLLHFLDRLESIWIEGVKPDFVLQEFVEGNEFACGSFWNGHSFVKDEDGDEICYENWEHKALFPGNLGESTGEQYTVIKVTKTKYSKLFSETLDKMREVLKRMDYRGYFDVNTIVTEKGAYFLEFTPRMGVPFTSGLLEIHKSKWFDFLKAVADGDDSNFKFDDRFTIISWLYTKPFPFVNSHKQEEEEKPTSSEDIAEVLSHKLSNSEDIEVMFKKDFTKDDLQHIHWDCVRMKDGKVVIANPDGYILTVSEQGDTPEEAGEKVRNILKKIVVPKAFWRDDFDRSNYHKSKDNLEAWGYLLDNAGKSKIDAEINSEKTKKEESIKEKKRVEVRDLLKKFLW